jgi:hypothetical protein
MRPSSPRLGLPWLFLFLAVFAAQVIPNIFENSPTADEPGEITGGYFYWQGDVLSDNAHPPLSKALQALPSRFLSLNQTLDPWVRDYLARTYDFFFVLNRDKFQTMLDGGRIISLGFGLGIGVLLFWMSRSFSLAGRWTVMVLWAFEPTLLAFAGLAVADSPVTFFFLAAATAFQKHLERPGWKWAAGAGTLAAMAVTCKFSALVLLPIFMALEFLNARSAKKAFKPKRADWIWGALAFIGWIGLLYLPGSLSLPHPFLPWAYFQAGFWNMAGQTHAYHPTYFLGAAGHHNHLLYYPAAFLLKSTVPFIFLLSLALGLALRKKIVIPAWTWLPSALFFLLIVPVQNLGVRYLLPAYPFLILMAAQAAAWLWTFRLRPAPSAGKIGVAALLFWHLGTTLLNHAGLLSYFNDFVPPQKKISLLADSNLDWGQDEKRLARAAFRRGWTGVKAAQLSGADLSLYGLTAQPWTQRDLGQPQPGQVYVVNASFVQLGPVFYPDLEPLAQSWISSLPPTGEVGDTWFYWEIPGISTPDPSQAIPSIRTAGTLYQGEIKGGH